MKTTLICFRLIYLLLGIFPMFLSRLAHLPMSSQLPQVSHLQMLKLLSQLPQVLLKAILAKLSFANAKTSILQIPKNKTSLIDIEEREEDTCKEGGGQVTQ